MSVDLQKLTDLVGGFPLDNIDDAQAVIDNYCCDYICIITTNRATNIVQGTHSHNSYEFVLPYIEVPSSPIDNKMYYRKANSIFAVNPYQEHGIACDIKGFNLCGIHVDKSFMQSTAASISNSSNIHFSNDSFAIGHDLSMLLRLFLEELRFKQQGYEFMVENLCYLIAGSLIRDISNNLQPKPHNLPKRRIENINKVIDYMNENYAENISCSEISSLVNMDKFGFIRCFKAQVGKTPYEYFLDLKIEKAKKMLKANDYSITEISMMCGFSSHSHFTSTFKKKVGISPTEFREKS